MPRLDPSDPVFLSASLYAVSLALFFLYRRYGSKSRVAYPPGPPSDFITGNWRQLPSSHAHLYYMELTKRYGQVVQLTAFGTRIILLGNYDTTNRIFGKRGTIYSDRPRVPITDLMIGSNAPPMSEYGPKWKEERRLYHAYLGKDTVANRYGANIETNIRSWLSSSIRSGTTSSAEFDKAVIKVFMWAIYGIEVKSDNDEFLRNTLGVPELSSPTTIPGRELANVLPFVLRLPTWLTRLPYKEKGAYARAKIGRMISAPFQKVAASMLEPDTHPSFTFDMLTGPTTLTNEQIMLNSGSALLAGMDTTAGTVQHFLRAMLCHPDIQKKAQTEVDEVIGEGHLPTFEDCAKLPYLQAVYREVLRWHPAVAFGLAHSTTKDDVYNGWTIPKGTIVISNNWAISRDEGDYSNPEDFRPERFLGDSPELDPKLWAFSIGRRICPGMNFAEHIVLATMATILATVNVARTENTPDVFLTPGGLIDGPLPFELRLVPRFEGALAMLTV